MKLSVPPAGAVPTLLAAELRMLCRDRRTLFASVLLPLLVLPLFFLATKLTERKRVERIEAQVFDYAVTGTEAELARQLLASALPPAGEEADRAAGVKVELRETEHPEPRRGLEQREIFAVVEAFSASEAEALLATAEEAPPMPGDGPRDEVEKAAVPLLRLVYLANWDASQTAVGALESRLSRARDRLQGELLQSSGFPVAVSRVAEVVELHDVATAGERTGASLGRAAALFLSLMLMVGGSVVAADTLAGEKERGTLETLLTSAAERQEIIVAKLLAILLVGLFIAVVQLVNLAFYVGLEVLDLPADFAVDLSPVAVVWLLLLFLPLATLIAAVLLWVSGRSATYKAFQINFLPVLLLFLAPAAAPLLPGLDLRSAVAVVPVAGVAVALREVLAGRFDTLMLALTWLVSAATAGLVVRASMRDLGSERLMTVAEVDEAAFEGGSRLFPRHVLRWFAVMWVVIFLAVTNVEALSGLRAQVLFNVVVVFLGGSLLMIRRYRLEPRQALAFRAAPPAVWLAVVLGAPATLLAGVALTRLSGWLFPLPRRMLEALGEGLVSADLSLAELLVLVAILPGICEEIAFRGVLLHGLERRFSPVVRCLVVGAVFAVFHMELVRLLPTFFFGTMLAALTLISGSVLPAILWHMLSNAGAILAARAGVDLAALDGSVYGMAAMVSALAWTLIWRRRQPAVGASSSQAAATAR